VLATIPEVRSCAVTSGPHNLVIDVWLRDLPEVHTLEAHLSTHLPPLEIRDRSVVVRTTKHMGRLLSDDGRRVAVVPVDPVALRRRPPGWSCSPRMRASDTDS